MNIWQNILANFGAHPTLYVNLAVTLLVLIFIFGFRSLLIRFVSNRIEDTMVLYQWKKTSNYVAAALSIVILVPLWVGGVNDIVTYLGLVSAGLAIALQGLILDIVAWLFIVVRRPFVVGDRIQIGDVAGDVIDLRVFQFSMVEIGNWVDADQSTGRVIHVPNRRVFTDTVANYFGGFEFIWNEIPVLVTFESNWRKAKQILEEIAAAHAGKLSEEAQAEVKKASRKYLIFYKNLSPRIYTKVEDSGVLLTMRYVCNPRKRRGTSEEIWEAILDRYAKCEDIDFAYPTLRTYDNRMEGKPGARA